MSIKNRLRRLEGKDGPPCPECHLKPTVPLPFYPDEGESEPQPEYCPSCSRALTVIIRVVYEEEGEG